jgi:Sulfotransferase family
VPAQIEQVPAPRSRDPLWFSPLFLLAPARSNSTVINAMLGMHPELWGFPELALFRRETVAEIVEDAPGWRGAPARMRLAGLLRSLAEIHDGEQTETTIAEAMTWVTARRSWRVESILDHLLAGVAPRIGVEKSPEHSSHDHYLKRLAAAYPRARFLHVTRHPLPSIESMYKHWNQLGYWDIDPELFHHFCLGVWFHQHRRIAQLIASLPPDRGLQVRSEDLLNAPRQSLPGICRWLGVDAGPEAIEAMCHPERSPHARLGPPGALGGGDAGFLRDPALRTTALPSSLDLPESWTIDPWQWLAAIDLATRFGYRHTARDG